MSKSLAKNSIFNIIYTILNLAYPLITSIYVSRVILSDGVGKVAFAQSIVSYFVTVASLGLPIYGLREVAKERENNYKLNLLFTELFSINGIATTVALALYVGLIFLFEPFKSLIYLYLSCGLLIVFNYFNVDWFYKGLEEYGYILIRSLVVKILSLVALFVFVRDINDFIIYALISSLATGGNHLFNFIHCHKYVKFNFKGIKLKQHLIPVFILAGSAFLESIYGKIDITMLGAMASDSGTGLYSYAHKTIILVISACTAITTVFMPKLSYYYKSDTEKFNNILKLGLKVLMFVSIPFCVATLILAPKIMVVLYGTEFSSAGLTLRIFAPLIIIASFGDIICYQLTICTGHEKMRLPAAFIGTIINIALNFILIPILFENGAAIASIISEFLINIYLFIKIRKIISIPFDYKALLISIVTTLLMAMAIIAVCFIHISDLLICIISALLGIAVYFITNLLFKNELCLSVIRRIKCKIVKKEKSDSDIKIQNCTENNEEIKENEEENEEEKFEEPK